MRAKTKTAFTTCTVNALLKSRVSSSELLNNLHRMLKQPKKIISNEYIVKCLHTSNFTWEEAYLELDMAENAGLRSPLDFAALRLIMYKLGELSEPHMLD